MIYKSPHDFPAFFATTDVLLLEGLSAQVVQEFIIKELKIDRDFQWGNKTVWARGAENERDFRVCAFPLIP